MNVPVRAREQLRQRIAPMLTQQSLDLLRWVCVFVWVCALGLQIRLNGIPFDRESVILWLMGGGVAFTVGRRSVWTVFLDWVPFALALIAYDFARGASDTLGMPTWWHPQLDVDKVLFGGTVPTLWLQEHLKYANAQWWDAVVCATYISFFLMPYVVAGILWVRSRGEFRRWTGRFVGLSLFAFACFAVIPAAPPWAAARCTAAEVANHPSHPDCLSYSAADVPSGGMLGPMTSHRPGALPYLERLSGRGWPELHLRVAQKLLQEGQATSNLVAAVPSLHAGGTMLLAIFLWRRVRRPWRALLVAYNLMMGFALVYAGEHYVSDILAGWVCAAVVSVIFARVERRRRADRLDAPTPAGDSSPPADVLMER